MQTIASYNLNGIRAALRRGFSDWLATRRPDVLALQELRCPLEMLPVDAFAGYWAAIDTGRLAGRNGVAVLSRSPITAVSAWGDAVLFDPHGQQVAAPAGAAHGLALSRELRVFRQEGRYLEVELDASPTGLTAASLYVPKGDSPTHPDARTGQPPTADQIAAAMVRYQRKMSFLTGIERQLGRSRRAALADGRHFVVLGDFNVAHERCDVRNATAAQHSAGFLPEEREWLDRVIGSRTLVDVIRRLHPDEQGPYSWWSWMGRAFDRDTGWRIDYQLATPGLAKTARTGGTDKDASADRRVSDHAPIVIDYDLPPLSASPNRG